MCLPTSPACTVRLDVTADTPASRELLQRYQVPGPPSLIWIGPEGDERRARRITGEVDAAAFKQHWAQTRAKADADRDPGATDHGPQPPATARGPGRGQCRGLVGGPARR